MPGNSPTYRMDTIDPSQAGWNNVVDENFSRTQSAFNTPNQRRRCRRVSGGGVEGEVLNLVNYPAGSFKGHEAYLEDPEVGERPQVYSDGTDWRYFFSDTVVTGIS